MAASRRTTASDHSLDFATPDYRTARTLMAIAEIIACRFLQGFGVHFQTRTNTKRVPPLTGKAPSLD